MFSVFRCVCVCVGGGMCVCGGVCVCVHYKLTSTERTLHRDRVRYSNVNRDGKGKYKERLKLYCLCGSGDLCLSLTVCPDNIAASVKTPTKNLWKTSQILSLYKYIFFFQPILESSILILER